MYTKGENEQQFPNQYMQVFQNLKKCGLPLKEWLVNCPVAFPDVSTMCSDSSLERQTQCNKKNIK